MPTSGCRQRLASRVILFKVKMKKLTQRRAEAAEKVELRHSERDPAE
jgi:hypothetical protein